MLLIHAFILLLAIFPGFEGKKKKKHKEDYGDMDRPESMGTDQTPESCIKRGIEFGVTPDLNGDNNEWIAAVCPGVMRGHSGSKHGKKGKHKKKKGKHKKKKKKGKHRKKKKKHSLERRSLNEESQWESCAWGIEHGAVCQRCHSGGGKNYPKQDIVLNGCATRYQYKIVNWPNDNGPQQRSFLEWVKGQDTSSAPDRQLLNSVCPGVFDSYNNNDGDGSNDSPYDACMWGWKHGSSCMARGPLSDLIIESADRGCSLRYEKFKKEQRQEPEVWEE